MSKARVILLLGLIAVLSIALTVMAHGNNVLLWTIRFLGTLGIIYTIQVYQKGRNKRAVIPDEPPPVFSCRCLANVV